VIQHLARRTLWTTPVPPPTVGRMSDTEIIEEVRIHLRRAIPPGSRVLVYGARAGRPDPDEHLRILIIEPHVHSLIDEAIRLRRALNGLPTPLAIRVIDEERARLRAAVRGTTVSWALRDGELLVRT
jgi:hypothetical protein